MKGCGMTHYNITLSKTVVAWPRGHRVCVRGSRKDGRQVRGNNRSPPDRTVATAVNTNLTMLRWYPVASWWVKDIYINKKIYSILLYFSGKEQKIMQYKYINKQKKFLHTSSSLVPKLRRSGVALVPHMTDSEAQTLHQLPCRLITLFCRSSGKTLWMATEKVVKTFKWHW